MLAQGFVRNQGDGWTWTLDYLGRTVEELAVTGETEAEAETDAFAAYGAFAQAMGRRLGELHAVLSEDEAPADFSAEMADAAARDAWAEGAVGQLRDALACLEGAGLTEEAAVAEVSISRAAPEAWPSSISAAAEVRFSIFCTISAA